jgi:transcriptional regulator with XRE-family HTH domain
MPTRRFRSAAAVQTMTAMANKIREMRIAKGMTVDQLAAETGLSQPYLSRLEKGRRGKRGIPEDTAQLIAKALESDIPTVMGYTSNSVALALAEDASPYQPQHDDLLLDFVKKRQNVMPYTIRTNVLDRLDIFAGDVVLLDISADAVENVEPMAAVVARIYGSETTTPVTVLRQFVPPSLLITNSTGRNMPMLDLEKDPVAIKGVIVAKHRSMKR